MSTNSTTLDRYGARIIPHPDPMTPEKKRQIELAAKRFGVIFHMLKSGASVSDVADVVEDLAKFHGANLTRKEIEQDILEHWEGMLEDGTLGRKRGIAQEVREFVLSTDGNFSSTFVEQSLQLSTREQKKNLSIILRRLREEGLIKKVGEKTGQYVLVDTKDTTIDWRSADKTPIRVRFPLGVHEFVQVHKGNVIIVAGESNAGKTAFSLNMARLNQDLFPGQRVNYMSSEMRDGTELRIRIDEFQLPDDQWNGIDFRFTTDNHPERIIPEAFNIVDYLDEGKDAEAYKMTARIKRISDRLTTGIVLICLQKDPNKKYGFGGAGTLNAARVYLTIERKGILTIEKAKIWRDKSDNPNGKFIQFKLAAGCRFQNEGTWQNPRD